MEEYIGDIITSWIKYWVQDQPLTLLETLESQQPNEPSSDETDIGDQDNDCYDGHNSTSAVDGDI